MITLDGLALPAGLFFRDEIAYTPIKQTNIVTTTGKTLIMRGTLIDGRPITITGTSTSNLIYRVDLKILAAKRGSIDPMDLVINGVTYKVKFDLSSTEHFVAKPLWSGTVALSDDSPFYIEKLMFIEVEE